MLFQVITTLALVSSVVAGKLVPDKLVKKGFVERSVRTGSCMNTYQLKEAMALPLGACVPSLQNNTKIKFSKLAMQTFKQTNVVHLEVQGFADSKCKRKVGKQSIWHSAEMGQCRDESINYMMHAVTLNYMQTPPMYSDPGLVEVQFRGSNCGGPEHANPVEMNYAGNYQCVNGTISGSLFTRSMMVYAESNFVTEYTEFNCMGMSSYVNLPSEWNNIPTCWNYGTHSSMFQVNHYVYPTYAPYSHFPTMTPTEMPVSNPNVHYFNATYLNSFDYDLRTFRVPTGATAIKFELTSFYGNCDLYVGLHGAPTTLTADYIAASPQSPDWTTIPVGNCPPEGCMWYVAVYGTLPMGSYCQLSYETFWLPV